MDRPANDTTSEARVVSEVYLIDPTTKLPYAASGGGGGGGGAVTSVDLGVKADTSATTDTGSFSLIALTKRSLEKLTALAAQFPASLGAKAASASFAVTQSTEDAARIGATNETAATADTGTFGLNALIKRGLARFTALLAALPATLGSKSAATSFAVALSTEDKAAVDLLHTDLTTPATELPKTPLMATSDLTYAFNSSSLSTERSLVTATASQTTKGYRMSVSAAAATTFEFLDGSGGAALYTLEFPAAGAYVLDLEERPYFKGAANTALFVKSSNAVKTTVALFYVKSA